jgi:hypothetical protein
VMKGRVRGGSVVSRRYPTKLFDPIDEPTHRRDWGCRHDGETRL